MFLDIDFPSVNREIALRPGTYRGDLKLFASAELEAYVYLYARGESSRATACDLLVVDREGRSWTRDFVQLEDLGWRDSDGRRSPDLWSLMPEEVRQLPLIDTDVLPTFEVTP